MVCFFFIFVGCSFLGGTYYLTVTQQEIWFQFFNAQSLVFFSGIEFLTSFFMYLFMMSIFLFGGCIWIKKIRHLLLFFLCLCWQIYFLAFITDFLSFTFVDCYLPVYIPQFGKWWRQVLFVSSLQYIFFFFLFFPFARKGQLNHRNRLLYFWSTTLFCIYNLSLNLWLLYMGFWLCCEIWGLSAFIIYYYFKQNELTQLWYLIKKT